MKYKMRMEGWNAKIAFNQPDRLHLNGVGFQTYAIEENDRYFSAPDSHYKMHSIVLF